MLIPAIGVMGTMLAIAVYRPLDQTRFLWVGLIPFFVIVILVGHIRRKAMGGGDVSGFFPVVYWVACAPAVVALALWLNGTLDRSVPETHQQLVTRKYVSHGRHGASYYIECTSWRPDRTTETVSVKYRQYTQFRIDDSILVEVHRGALAIPWIGDVRKPE